MTVNCTKPASENPGWNPNVPIPACPEGKTRNAACCATCLNTYHAAVTAAQATYCAAKDVKDFEARQGIAECLASENADPDNFDYFACVLGKLDAHTAALAVLEGDRLAAVALARGAYRDCMLECPCE